jgi:dihydrofolate synthase/folylpolyglutamate synthase
MMITNFLEANQYLAGFYNNAKVIYTLETMRQLMEALDNPQDKYRVIHIAGTSGKSSTAYYAAALLTAAGYKTGLTVSPHVDEINERVQIDMKPAEETVFCTALTEFQAIVAATGISPSWFEAMVAFAYWFFAREQVDYAVIEVGLGGLHDGTNVINRADKVCVITDIGFDHTKILGDTLPLIAAQKAGIIHPGNRVFMHTQPPEVEKVISDVANDQHAELTVIPPHDYPAGALPAFQERNYELAAVAVTCLLVSDNRQPLALGSQGQARRAYIPGRMEIVHYEGKIIILDGAHNTQKLGALEQALHAQYPESSVAALVAFAEGDELRLAGALDVIHKLSHTITVTSFVTAKDYIKRSVNPEVVANQAKFQMRVEPDAATAFNQLLDGPEQVILVTGSFYLLNHIRPLMLKV